MTERTPNTRPIADELAAEGDVLFRWRSYIPLVLVPLFVISLAGARRPTPFSFEIAAFVIALAGLALRAWIVGTAPEGTSARGTGQPTADLLNISGAYSVVRHPLYVANTVIWFGCSLIAGVWFLPVIVVLLSFIYHERIAVHEEAFLLQTFGDQFRVWAASVPAIVPRFDRYRAPSSRFNPRKAFMQESHGLCALGTAFFFLDTLEDSVRLHAFHADARWLAIFAACTAPLAVVLRVKRSARKMAKA